MRMSRDRRLAAAYPVGAEIALCNGLIPALVGREHFEKIRRGGLEELLWHPQAGFAGTDIDIEFRRDFTGIFLHNHMIARYADRPQIRNEWPRNRLPVDSHRVGRKDCLEGGRGNGWPGGDMIGKLCGALKSLP